ncbi:unnamed protein product [Pleuronectes platessa]|uniref:Uncharacterized protein n=1 Tax=Pleuronectes platessa TaxID=8262 RepID=A0A9N7UYM3_PLEPL|nr:unnamed protein product [Pleuronectes platessa]
MQGLFYLIKSKARHSLGLHGCSDAVISFVKLVAWSLEHPRLILTNHLKQFKNTGLPSTHLQIIQVTTCLKPAIFL